MSEWARARVADVALTTDYVANGSFESLRGNVTYMDVPDYAILARLVDHNASWAGPFVYVNKASYDFLRKSSLFPGDIVIANVGANAGTVFRIPDLGTPMTLGPNAILCRPVSENILNQGFLYYYLSSPSGQELLHSIRSGSAQPKFNKTDLRALTIPLPPITEQRAIAATLGALDEKIQANRRLADTLETSAQAIFRSRFVTYDADPDADLTASEIGMIPAGWRASRLDEVAETLLGGTPSRTEPRYWGGDIPWLNSGKANEFRVTEPTEYITPVGLEESATKLVPARTTLVAITGATLGQITVTEIDTCINQSLVAVLGSESLPTEFLYFWLKQRVGDLLAAQTGAAQQHVNKNDVNRLWVLRPPPAVIQDYARTVRPIFDRIALACRESLALASVRDRLLSRLMRGAA